LAKPFQQGGIEGISILIMGTVATTRKQRQWQLGPQPPHLLGHLNGYQSVALSPDQQQGKAQALQQGWGCGAMGPQGHGDAHRPQGSDRSRPPGRSGNEPV
jgi:hypothetical protein